MSNNERLRPTIDFTSEQESAINQFATREIPLYLRLFTYGLNGAIKRRPDGVYTAEEIKTIIVITISKLNDLVKSSQTITNSEYKRVPRVNDDFVDALHNVRILIRAIPELKPLFAIALEQHQ